MSKTNSSYSVFAPFYDAAMGDMSDKVTFLKKLLREHAPEAQTLLEMACGTGIITKELSSVYDVAGLDLSPEMIDIARKKLPGVKFKVGDMAATDFGKTFDVVLCVFDSVNHLEKWDDWRQMFQNVHKHLNDGGLFIFDINTIQRLEWLANNPPFSKQLGNDYMVMGVQKEDEKFNWDVKIFQQEKDGRYALHQDMIHEVSFPVEDIQKELSELFTVEDIVDVRNLEPTDPNWRPFFVCRKK
ncbi:MAG TPA: class I SAM-dependent methyltransferase [Candidatus Limnocylindria bacterium]|nr:class I SAM-dependent methyltransferase [Candidatus Limnocylindria bacterium]